ncbi:hypothetical protein FRC05_011499 [Tulasnella sp. 425]|nr:hypothetical protein FRC05_011499 [Tulasnella sp. 425]
MESGDRPQSEQDGTTSSFLNPSNFQHAVQQATAIPPTQQIPSQSAQPSIASAGRTCAASKRAQYNAANAADEAAQHEIQRFEDPAEPNPRDKGDTEFTATNKQRKKAPKNGRFMDFLWVEHADAKMNTASKNTKTNQAPPVPASNPIQSHSASIPSPSILAPPTPFSTATSSTHSQLYLSPYPQPTTSPYFTTSPATIGHHLGPQPTLSYQPSYPTAVTVGPVPFVGDAPRPSAAPPSSVVPMGIWSHSSSPHGGLLDGGFPVNPSMPPGSVPASAIPAQLPPGLLLQGTPLGGFTSDDEEDNDDILRPFSPVLQLTTSHLSLGSQASTHAHNSTPPNTGDTTDSRQSSEAPEQDDVLEVLRSKARRCRRPHSRLAPASGDSSTMQASLEKIDADPTNLYAYTDQERPLLHLARVIYGAMLVTKEAMPSSATARAFQTEAYHEAGRLVTSIPPTLPSTPSNTILRLIAKHASASRGRLKVAALNAVLLDYGIKADLRADPSVIASRVARLLERKNFTYREVTAEGRTGIFRNPAIANVLINTLFRNRKSEGVLVKHLFLPLIPEGAIFMACTVIKHALDMWSTGVKVSKDFSNDHVRHQVWIRHRTTWFDYIERKGEAGEKYAQETREMITVQIRAVLDGLNPTSSQPMSLSDGESFFDENDGD